MTLPLALVLSNDAQRRYFAEGQTSPRTAARSRRTVSRRRRRAQID